MNNNKVFDDYSELCECLKCEHYYNSQCDGVRTVGETGLVEPCKTYKPTRGVIIPKDIKDLKMDVKRLYRSTLIMDLLFIAHCLTHILGSWLGW